MVFKVFSCCLYFLCFSFPFAYLDSAFCVRAFLIFMAILACIFIGERNVLNCLTGSFVFICEDFQMEVIGLEPSHRTSKI